MDFMESMKRVEYGYRRKNKPKKKNNPSEEDRVAKAIAIGVIGVDDKQN